MHGRCVGYAVVEFNQASGQPRLADDDVHHTPEDAATTADWHRERTASYGRRERYAVADVVLREEPR